MPEFTSHQPGTFSWPELATTDQTAAVQFYRSLFGWDVEDTPMGPDDRYSVFFFYSQIYFIAPHRDVMEENPQTFLGNS